MNAGVRLTDRPGPEVLRCGCSGIAVLGSIRIQSSQI